MLLHIPHSSTKIKHIQDYTNTYNSIQYLTDWYSDDLFQLEGTERMVFPFSRIYCDVERLKENEEMDKHNMGILYTKNTLGLLRLPQQQTVKNVMELYTDWHEKLNTHEYIVDCHTFHPDAMSHEKKGLRPDFCIGTTEKTPVELVKKVKCFLNENGYVVFLNFPFSGSVQTDNTKNTIMLEVNRNLYLSRPYTGTKSKNYNKTKTIINKTLKIIKEFYEVQGDI